MLCNRPGDVVLKNEKSNPFISRVFNHEKIGLNPCIENI